MRIASAMTMGSSPWTKHSFLSLAVLLVVVPYYVAGTTTTTATTTQRGDLSNPDQQNIRLTETERVEEYYKRNYTWPISDAMYRPNTPGWKGLMEERFRQVERIPDMVKRYEGYIQTIHSAFLVPNFTEYGFGLARAPESLMEDLRTAIRDGYNNGQARYENMPPVINGPEPPLFIDRPDLTKRVLHELESYAETWSGIELTPYRAYGFRLYQNNSQLTMHVDKMQTHVISFILHIDSSDDADPWPIFIEDYHGQTHEVILKSGDMLFYESTKLFHGRPRRLNGSWYCSIFVHYYPSHNWYDLNHELEAHYAVPPRWANDPDPDPNNLNEQKQPLPKLVMLGTSLSEPECDDDWCRTQNSVKWSGPGQEGYVINPDGTKSTFEPKELQAPSPQQEDEL